MKGFLYQRPNSSNWWVAYYDETGKRRQISSGSPDKAFAARLLASLERKIAAASAAGIASDVMTVEKYADRWLKDREQRGIASWKDDKGRLAHVFPVLGQKRLEDVKPADLRAFMAELRAKGELAPRTVRHVYGTLRVMFSDALAEEFIRSTPCILKERRGEIPKKQDADLSWRDTAVYSREEVEQLVAHERIPLHRRAIYALLFLGGMRIGEVAARTWADWDESAKPLTALSVRTSYNRKLDLVKGVKTDRPRIVPVHPALAAILREWRAAGWPEMIGREPRADDLVVPSQQGKHLRDPNVLINLHSDLKKIGARPRRVHDARRTFISLELADGADRALLRWITHGPPGDILGAYTSLPWEALCREVLKLRISVTPELHPDPPNEKAPKSQGLGGSFGLPRAGFEAELLRSQLAPVAAGGAHSPLESPCPSARSRSAEPIQCNCVTDAEDPSGYERLAHSLGFVVASPWTH